MLIRRIDGADILFEGQPRTILHGDQPARFLVGWRAVLAYTGLAPVTIVTFESDQGGVGLWFLDADMRRQGGAIAELPAQMLADLVAALCPLLDGIWRELLLSRRPQAMDAAQEAFFALPEHCRQALLDLYLRCFDFNPACVTIDQAAAGPLGFPILRCGSRHVPLIAGELHWLFDPGRLQRAFETLARDGEMTLRSPIDGGPMTCRASLPLETDLVAYRFHDGRASLTFYLLAGGIINRTLALYIPDANLVLCPDPEWFRAAWPNLTAMLHRHVARHGRALFAYLAGDRSEPVHFWRGRNAIHLGHVLWNDYSGIERLMLACGDRQPRYLVCETGSGPELYGALDDVFPELAGRVWREPAPLLGLVDTLYESNAVLFRTSGLTVTRGLRDRILALAPVRGADSPVVLLGLRTENRTCIDLPGFCRALVGKLAAGGAPVTLVVDGHNSRPDGGTIWSHGEHAAATAPIAIERMLVEVMRKAAHGTCVAIVSTIGAPLSESLAWGRAASMVVAFWGAGLAKYRWVCNCPGLVITSRWNLETLGDLRIYSEPRTMDDPTRLAFVPVDAVTDRPDAPVLIAHGEKPAPSLVNFELSLPLVMQAFEAAAAGLLRQPVGTEASTPAKAPARAGRPRRAASAARVPVSA
jgi:hypothetical protein